MHKSIYKLFFNYKLVECDHATGVRLELLSLFSIILTIFGFKGKRYMDEKGLFNIDISFQITPNLYRNRIFSILDKIKKYNVSLCRKCGPMVKHLVEHWVEGQSGPYMIEFIDYDDTAKPVMVDSIEIDEKPKGKSVKYLTCMNCHSMVVTMPIRQVERMIEERAMKKV